MQFILLNTYTHRRRAYAILHHLLAGEDAEKIFDRLLKVLGMNPKVVDVREDGTFWCDGAQVQLTEPVPVPVEPPPVPVEPEPEPEPEWEPKPAPEWVERKPEPKSEKSKKGKKK